MLITGSNWLAFDVAILTSSFGLFDRKVQNLQYSVFMVKHCKPVFLEGFLQPMFFQWILDLAISNEWILWSSKPCLARVFAGGPFLFVVFAV